ncbi:hypothetical protein AUH73_00370 [archaeon 13_1_40CM_4_53_4]|nr:MAG: hypothetical protein AUH73_00370 [archaeon 13_1_40CM_4_53_4]
MIDQELNFVDKDGQVLRLTQKFPLAVDDVLRLNGIPVSSVLVSEKKDGGEKQLTAKFLFNTVFRIVGSIPIQRKILKTSPSEPTFYEKVIIGPDNSGKLERLVVEMDRSHFSDYVENTFTSLVRKENMFTADDDVVIGFSGGTDSAILLHLLLDEKRKASNARFTAVTVGTLAGTHRMDFMKHYCKEYGVEHFFIDDNAIEEAFNLNRSVGRIIDQILASEYNQKAIFVVQHIIRRMLEKFRESRNCNKIVLGLEREALLTSILSFYLSGEPIAGLYKKTDGTNNYVFPLMSLFKREENLYMGLKLHNYYEVDRSEHSKSRTYDLHSSEWRGLVMLLVGHLLDVFPGIDVYLERAAAKMIESTHLQMKFGSCENCGGSFVPSKGDHLLTCEACSVLSEMQALKSS